MYLRFTKRVFDFLLCVALIPLLSPIIAVLYLLVRLDGGAGFFGHVRIGQNGKKFRCWKIRTMVPDSQERLVDYLASNADAAAEWERDHKLDDDPRITKLGSLLRRTSMDELPQLWNVLKGEMSFVGPRPVVRDEMRKYGHYRSAYMAIKPGVTGLWQVSGRNNVSYDERVRMDVEYLRKVSFVLDLRILFATGGAVLNTTGK